MNKNKRWNYDMGHSKQRGVHHQEQLVKSLAVVANELKAEFNIQPCKVALVTHEPVCSATWALTAVLAKGRTPLSIVKKV